MLSTCVPKVIVCAADAGRVVHESIGYAAGKMLVISNGFDIQKLVFNPVQRFSVRACVGFSDEHVVIGSVGRFDAVKDQKNFVEAAAFLAWKHPHLRFMMVGRDITKDNRELMSWISATGFEDRFVLLGERSDMPACLSALDIFCMHSRTEGFPNVVGEAMAVGKPCVVTDVGDAAFLVDQTGVVVQKENSKALANGIEVLLALSAEELIGIGKSARKRIYSQFTMNHSRLKFEELYQRLSGACLE